MQSHQKKQEDIKREEQLFLYLQKSYADSQKGTSTSMNKIVEEVCRKKKDVAQIILWVELFNRLLLQLHKSGGDPKLIIDIVLYKIPWFTSENHFKALKSFTKILFTIISTSSCQLLTIYRFLVQRLHLQMQIDHEQTRDDISCEVGGQSFQNKAELLQYINEIVNSINLESEDQIVKLSENNKSFIKELLQNHPKADEKLRNMVDIGYGYFPAKNKSKCFYIIRKDKTVEDVSYIKAIEGLYNKEYRERYFGTRDTKCQDSAIQIIFEITQIYKLSKEKLLDVLSELFPHKNQSELHQRVYAINCMKLSDKIIDLRQKIFKMVYVKILQIDSEIKYDPIFNNFIIKTTLQQQLHKKHRDEMCKKVDYLLDILFDYFDSKSNINSKSMFMVQVNEELQSKIFRELQTVFQEIMLKNQYYRMAHFMFLYLCSVKDKFNQLFLSQLVSNIRSTALQKNERINSIYYLSSLLVRCNSVKQTVFIRAVEMLIQYLNDDENLKDIDFEYHLVQMMVFLISTKSTQLETLRDKIYNLILKLNNNINALQFIHYDVLVKFNEVLLRQKSDEIKQKLIEITAKIISSHIGIGQGEVITNHHSPNTPQKLVFDHESLFSKTTTLWNNNIVNKNNIDFYQPFNSMTLIYSESFIKEFYRYDEELVKDEGGSLNSSHVEDKRKSLPLNDIDKPIKKIKW